jgi:predicted metal-binding protein
MADNAKNQNDVNKRRLNFFCTVNKCNGPMVFRDVTLIEGEMVSFAGYCASCMAPLEFKCEISELIKRCPPRRQPKPISLDAAFSDEDRSLY